MSTPKLLDKAQGCFIGLAIGDALGACVEFEAPGTFEYVVHYRDGGPFNLKAGQYTDDSSMALCLAESLIACDGMDLKDQMIRYASWYKHGNNSSTGVCFDIGNGTANAIEKFLRTGVASSGGITSAGNGSLMRLAPVPIRWWYDVSKARAMSRQSAITTHKSPDALDATEFMGKLICYFLQGFDRERVKEVLYDRSETINRITQGPWEGRHVTGNGYVLSTLEAALWAFFTTDCFEDCVTKAVNLGEDSDTVGAVAGQIAGACYGLSNIPERFITNLQDSDKFLTLARELVYLPIGH